MTGALAIFVKTPGRSAVKTRLAAARGQGYAEQWYRLAAAAVASVATRACAQRGMTAYWAVAEADAESDWSDLTTIAQGDGGLGERMARVHNELVARHGFALLIGADAPQLRVDALVDAAAWLDAGLHAEARLVMGPACDGGFWLFGANCVITDAVWTSVRYSRTDTGRRFHTAMQAFGAWKMVGTLSDVDHVEDLEVVRAALEELAEPTLEQRALLRWMQAKSPASTHRARDRPTRAEPVPETER